MATTAIASTKFSGGSFLLDVGNETEWHVTPLRTPDWRCADLLEAAQHIVNSESGQFHSHPMPGMAGTR